MDAIDFAVRVARQLVICEKSPPFCSCSHPDNVPKQGLPHSMRTLDRSGTGSRHFTRAIRRVNVRFSLLYVHGPLSSNVSRWTR